MRYRGPTWNVLLLCVTFSALQCGRERSADEAAGYQAPRNLGESVTSWYREDAGGSGGAVTFDMSGCPEPYSSYADIPLECSSWYLGTQESWDGLPARLKVLWEYAALLDYDYSAKPVAPRKDAPANTTKLEVRRVIEEYLNLLPKGTWDKIVVAGICDEKGHCIMDEGGYPMPLWSGVNLVFGRIGCYEDYPPIVFLYEVYAVEGDVFYDFYGFSYNWPEMREKLRKAGEEAMATRPLVCTAFGATPPSENPMPRPDQPPATEQPTVLPDPGPPSADIP